MAVCVECELREKIFDAGGGQAIGKQPQMYNVTTFAQIFIFMHKKPIFGLYIYMYINKVNEGFDV